VSDRIAVAIDFASPAAYLAVAPARALESRLGRPFDWLPFSISAVTRPKPAAPGEDRGSRHRRARAEYLALDLCRYAASRGFELGDPYRAPEARAPSLGLLWLRRRAPVLASDYVTAVFDHLWCEHADAADLDFVAKTLGGEAAGFRAYASGEGPRDLAAVRAELEAAAVWNVPTFLVDGEPFLGRQHLPMVEWLATGRTGAPPI
jgi:2-hydroxychromene-2-carboxylate isomerase